MNNPWKGKRIFITGVCGTVGRELLRQMLQKEPLEVIGIDNNESELFFTSQMESEYPFTRFYLCDIRSVDRLKVLMQDADVVLHAAALKHVILNELSPAETVKTNIIGTQNVIEAAKYNKVERVIFTSSDKAVNPTNVMGTSKLMGERLMTAANSNKRSAYPIFASTRFGNVLGSSGSVIPLFKRQIESGGPVTLTDPSMTRFVMSIEEAANLVMDSVFLAQGGEVFVTKMPVMGIKELAEAMIDILAKDQNIGIKNIGAKPGEKMYEELINEEEVRRTIELENYFVTLPAFAAMHSDIKYEFKGSAGYVNRIYRSDVETAMTIDEIKDYLTDNQLV
jgi:FlaA1/EpsC-like NDP-sugar epimerase